MTTEQAQVIITQLKDICYLLVLLIIGKIIKFVLFD